jgi:transcriptional regulator with XRE-family HTH domain
MSEEFGQRLSAALASRGLNQGGLASICGVTPAAVSTWVRGQVPRPAKLMQIAEALQVSVDYLTLGKGDVPVDVDGLRAQYAQLLSVYARPAPFDGGREYGNTAEHAFELNLKILAREVGQNSGDEQVEGGDGVDMVFTIIELAGDDFKDFISAGWWRAYRRHLDAGAAGSVKAARQLKQAIDRMDRERRMILLRVDDYGANGLTGPEYGSGRFTAVMRNQLDSRKGAEGGGSFGLGKNAMWGCSEFSLVLANSRLSVPEEGQTENRFIGRGQLPAHSIGEEDYAGPVWLGQQDPSRTNPDMSKPPAVKSIFDNPVLVDDLYLAREGNRPGSSFLVVGFFDPSGEATTAEKMADELAQSLASNFWAAMTPRSDRRARLHVEVRSQRGHNITRTNTVGHDGVKPGFVQAYEKHLAGETVDTVEQLQHPGDVLAVPIPLMVPRRVSDPTHEEKEHNATLLVRLAGPDEPDTGKIVWLRGSLMTISEERVPALPVGAAQFHAVLLAGRAAADDVGAHAAEAFLRSGEPPQHDKWIPTGDLTTSYATGAKTRLEKFKTDVRDAVRDAVKRTSTGTSDGPADLKNLLRIGSPPQPTDSRPRVKSASGRPAADGSWPIEATVSLPVPKRRRLREWRLTPVVKFAGHQGSGIRVAWAPGTLEAVKDCRVEGDQLIADIGTRTLKFRGVTDPGSHPVDASLATLVVDVRAQEDATA